MTELIRQKECSLITLRTRGLDAADGKHLEVFSPSIGTQLLERGLIDEATSTSCRASSATAPGCTTSRACRCASCRTWVGDDPNAATNLRFRTIYEN